MANDQLKEIGIRVKELREIKGRSIEEVAENLGITVEEYNKYENGEKDFSFSVMYRLAELLHVDIINLLSGNTPRLYGCAVVRKGKGMRVEKVDAYEYKHLAYTFQNKKAEPFLVTIQPDDKIMDTHSHAGQEFNFVLEGTLLFKIGEIVYELEAGDSVYFDASIPHVEKAMGNKQVIFLAVVVK